MLYSCTYMAAVGGKGLNAEFSNLFKCLLPILLVHNTESKDHIHSCHKHHYTDFTFLQINII